MSAPFTSRDAATARLVEEGNRQRAAALKIPLTTAEVFERLAAWTMSNLTDAEEGAVADLVRQLTPHLSAQAAAVWWYDLQAAIRELAKAQDGKHPADVDKQTWIKSCRLGVDTAASWLAGTR